VHDFFNKHMKFRIQARLCLAIYDFKARINFSRYQTNRYEKDLAPMWLRSVNKFLVISIDLQT